MMIRGVIFFLMFFFLLNFVAGVPLLNPAQIGFNGQTLDQNYETLVNDLYSRGIVTTVIGDKLWVPWFSSSSSCQLNDLHEGNNCNSGETIDFTHNCMVTDELSQVGMVVAMSKDQDRMDQYVNTINYIASDKGQLPSWKVYRDGNSIESCRPGINGNCDTASDADARIISSLFIASKNPYFLDESKKLDYNLLALNLTRDFLSYEVVYDCKPSSLGNGNICYWLSGGAGAKSGGMSSYEFTYTGYFADAIIAMLYACANTNNSLYCEIADDFTLNYLQASNYNLNSFSAPPGKSFRWINTQGVPLAECSSYCSPVMWDCVDASRAVGICQANYYAGLINHQLPLLQQYCNQWSSQHMNNPYSAPIQYYPSGQAVNHQSSYFAQGLQSLHYSGSNNQQLFTLSLSDALSHYAPHLRTWDYTQCFGVYMPSFAVRSLGFGLGRDLASFTTNILNNSGPGNQSGNSNSNQCYDSVQYIPAACNGGQIVSDTYEGCRTILCSSINSSLQILACNKPGESNRQYFEMYKQQETGNGLQICIGNSTCINGNGFTQSPNFPLCLANNSSTNTNSTGNNNTQGAIGSYIYTCNYNGQNCNLVSDITAGDCRTIVSSTSAGNIQIQTCKKPNNTVEIYRQEHPASGVFLSCVHTGCVNNIAGFASFST